MWKAENNRPSSALICSTGGASSSEYSGSDNISALVTTAFRSTRSFPSQPLLFTGVVPLLVGLGPGASFKGVSIIKEASREL